MLPALLLIAITQLPTAPTAVPPSAPELRYVGRFDTRDPAGPRCEWTGSTVEIKYRGKDLSARINETGQDFLQVEVDEIPTQVLQLRPRPVDYLIEVPLRGEHTVRFVKRTEPFVGRVQFLGFTLPDGGSLEQARAPKRSIEIIGNSISCAFGNEGKAAGEQFTPATENGYLAYGPVAARTVGADCTVVAWSGRKMWPDNTMPAIYDLTLPTDPTSKWEFKGAKPQVVLINLSTNDFGKGNPDEQQWTGAYEHFISRIRSHYPRAEIYCSVGSMMSDDYPPGQRALTTVRGYIARMVERINSKGDRRVKFLEFAQQRQQDGIGASWHPSVTTHKKMADVFVCQMKFDLGWNPVVKERG